jgi:DHA2 family methylenomycin A resistance protein-like MFS transporter
LPLGLAGIWLTWRYSEETTQTENREIDYWGQFLGIVSLAAVAASTIEVGLQTQQILGRLFSDDEQNRQKPF